MVLFSMGMFQSSIAVFAVRLERSVSSFFRPNEMNG